jgi:hypothetical protein
MRKIVFLLTLPALALIVWPACAVAQAKAAPPPAKVAVAWEWRTEGVYMPTLFRDGKPVGVWYESRREFWLETKTGYVVAPLPDGAPKFVRAKHHESKDPPVASQVGVSVTAYAGASAEPRLFGGRLVARVGAVVEARPVRRVAGRVAAVFMRRGRCG